MMMLESTEQAFPKDRRQDLEGDSWRLPIFGASHFGSCRYRHCAKNPAAKPGVSVKSYRLAGASIELLLTIWKDDASPVHVFRSSTRTFQN